MFILIITLLFLLLAKKNLPWACFLLIASLPSYLLRIKLFGIPTTMLEIMILITFTLWLWQETEFKQIFKIKKNSSLKNHLKKNWQDYLEKRQKRTPYPYRHELIALLIISYIAMIIGGTTQAGLGIWKAYFFEPTLLYILILNIFGKYPTLTFRNIIIKNPLVTSLTISALLVSIFAIYQKITGHFIANDFWAQAQTRRVTSFFPYPNALGLYLGPIIIILISELRQNIDKNFRKILKTKNLFLITTICTSIAAIYFAKSEGALISVLAALIIFGILDNAFRKFTIAGLIICSILIFTNPQSKDYFREKITLRDLSGEIRKQQWRETMTMMRAEKRLIWGTGLANYQKLIAPYHQEGIFFNRDRDGDFRRKIVLFNEEYKSKYWQPTEIYLYPHNIFLNFWTELGIFGALLFIWIIGKFIFLNLSYFLDFDKKNTQEIPEQNIAKPKDSIQNQKYIFIGLACAMITITIHGLVDVPYFKNDLACLFWIIIAMGQIRILRK